MQTHKSQSLTKSKLLFIFGNSLINLLNGGEEDEVESRKAWWGFCSATLWAQATLTRQISTHHANWGRNSLALSDLWLAAQLRVRHSAA
jgi:hypothetical protein